VEDFGYNTRLEGSTGDELRRRKEPKVPDEASIGRSPIRDDEVEGHIEEGVFDRTKADEDEVEGHIEEGVFDRTKADEDEVEGHLDAAE
jgi:hypothetical protein